MNRPPPPSQPGPAGPPETPFSPPVDLTTHDVEPIHLIGRIQSFGYLLAFSSEWLVSHLSINCAELLGEPPQTLIGQPGAAIISTQALHDIRSRLQMLGSADAVERIFDIDLIGDGRLFDLAVHIAGRSFIVEAELAEAGRRRDYVGYVRPLIDRIRKAGSVEKLSDLATRQLRALTGFDSVMVCRFDPTGAGEVLAESLSSGAQSYRGLNFPGSEIPAQARELYTRNALRIISDVADPTVPIYPSVDPDGEALDLSLSGLRAVSPIHIESLTSMGVRSSMSISVLRRDRLWGLITCHGYTPRRLSYAMRRAIELYGEFFAYLLEQAETDDIIARRERTPRLHDAAGLERHQASERRDIPTAELDHRLRDMLGLVHAIVTQSRAGADTIDAFARTVGDRVLALARAHDQVSRGTSSPGSIDQLIRAEARARGGDSEARLTVTGIDAKLAPGASATLALVFHELMSNSARHGALSNGQGTVTVTLSRLADGGLEIGWRDRDGPRVKPPWRRGFGYAIIERTIPHELGGEAEIAYPPEGMVARFVLPPGQIDGFAALPARDPTPGPPPPLAPDDDRVLSGDALVVEGTMIVAMEAGEILRELGAARCHVAATATAGLALLDAHDCSFALLDIDLAEETSGTLAAALTARGVPFAFAGGHGGSGAGLGGFGGVPVVTKPYSKREIAAEIRALLDR